MEHSLALNLFSGEQLPDVRQTEAAECGLACLAMVAGYHGKHMDLSTLRRRFPVFANGASLRTIRSVAAELGLATRPLRIEMHHLAELNAPAILHWDMDHFVVLRRTRRAAIDIHDPGVGPTSLSFDQASRHFTGVALELTPTKEFERKSEVKRLRLAEVLSWPPGVTSSLAQALLLSVILQLYAVASPFYMQLTVDDAIAQNDIDLLRLLTVGFGLFLLVNVGASVLRSLVLVHLQNCLAYEMSRGVMRHLLRLPLSYFERRRTGDVMSRFGATEPIRALLTEGAVAAAVDGVMAATMAVLMLVYSATLTCVVVPALLLYVGLRLATYRMLRSRSLTSVQAKAREMGSFVETLRAIQTLKIFNREDERCSLWSNCRIEVLKADAATARLQAAFHGINDVIFGLENVLVVYFGASAVLGGRMSVGMLFAFMSYKGQFVDKAARLVEKAIEFRMLDVHLERLADIAGEPPEPHLARPLVPLAYRQTLRGQIEVRDLSFRYTEDAPLVLRDVSFTIAPGDYVAMVGPSGGGKTTLMKILIGLLNPTGGEVFVDSVPLQQFGVQAFRDQIGVVMQDDQLLSGSVADNICFFDDAFDLEWMRACASMAGIHEDIMRMPMGYNTLIGDMGSFLSGGQKQRIVLARALYRRPRILFMDEATSHLDVALERQVNTGIRALGLTRIIIAHRPETIASASRVLVVESGAVAEGVTADPGRASVERVVDVLW